MPNAFVEAARTMADVALADRDTVVTQQVMTGLQRLSRADVDGITARQAVMDILQEGTRRRFDSYPTIFLPHEAVQRLDALRDLIGLPRRPGPGVLPGTWRHDGIEVGQVLTLGLAFTDDHARRDDEDRGIRQARCKVVELRSDTSGTAPYVLYADIDRTDTGRNQIRLDAFRQAMERGGPEPTTPSGPRR